MTTEAKVAAFPRGDFAELRARVVEAGLLDRTPWRFALRFLCIIALWILATAGLFFLQNVWLIVLDVLLISELHTQVTFCAHEVGHRQIFKKTWKNNVVGLLCGVITGISFFWWIQTHNKHHENPNHEDLDPDIDKLFLTYAEKRAREKNGIARWIVRHQIWFFLPFMSLSAIAIRVFSIQWMWRQKGTCTFWLDLSILIAWLAFYASILLYLFPLWIVVILTVIYHLVFGFHLGIVFAPNHKGMLVVEGGRELDFLRAQVLTSRNVRGFFLTDFLYGGLNYQIEHHLFPAMPQWNYVKAQKIVREFCEERGIVYHETSFFGSMREVFWHLGAIGQYAAM